MGGTEETLEMEAHLVPLGVLEETLGMEAHLVHSPVELDLTSYFLGEIKTDPHHLTRVTASKEQPPPETMKKDQNQVGQNLLTKVTVTDWKALAFLKQTRSRHPPRKAINSV